MEQDERTGVRAGRGIGVWSRRLTAVVIAVLGTAGVTAAVATPALAMPGLQRITASSVTDSAAAKSVAAFCPAGTVALGGAAYSSAANPWDVKIRALGVHLTDVGSYYSAVADVASDPATVHPWTLSATAVCAPQPAGYEIRIGFTPFGTGTFKSASATCSAGKKVLSVGGFVATSAGGPTPQLTLSGFVSNTDHSGGTVFGQPWRYGVSGTWMAEVDLVCAAPPPGYAVQQNSAQFAGGVADRAGHGVLSACPAGTGSIGLGGAVGYAGQHVQPVWAQLYPTSAYVVGSPDTEGEAGAWPVTTQVICAA